MLLLFLSSAYELTIFKRLRVLVHKDPTPMLHQVLVHSVKVPTHLITSTEVHHLVTGVAVVLLDLGLGQVQVPTSETCLIPLLPAGFLLAKVSQVVLVDRTLPVALDHGPTTLSLQALVVLGVPVPMHPLRFLPTNGQLLALVPLEMQSRLPLALARIDPRLLLLADRHPLQSLSHLPKVCDNLHMPQHRLSIQNHQSKRLSKPLLVWQPTDKQRPKRSTKPHLLDPEIIGLTP